MLDGVSAGLAVALSLAGTLLVAGGAISILLFFM
jgi:hypothetical protein